jgi:predicted nucleotidyltransferase
LDFEKAVEQNLTLWELSWFSRYNQPMKRRPRVRALKLAAAVRERLTEALGQPVKVIMFGSQARGDATKYSDIDLFVVVPSLDDQTRYLISDVTWEVGFEAGKIVSAIPTTEEKMKQYGFLPLYRNVKKEGIPV